MLLLAHARGWTNDIAHEFESLRAMSAVTARETQHERSRQYDVMLQLAAVKSQLDCPTGQLAAQQHARLPPAPAAASAAQQLAAQQLAASSALYILADNFLGSKLGYVFTCGAQGTGYYRDGTSPGSCSSAESPAAVDAEPSVAADVRAPPRLPPGLPQSQPSSFPSALRASPPPYHRCHQRGCSHIHPIGETRVIFVAIAAHATTPC